MTTVTDSGALERAARRMSDSELRDPRAWGGILRFVARVDVTDEALSRLARFAGLELARRGRLADRHGVIDEQGRWPLNLDIWLRDPGLAGERAWECYVAECDRYRVAR